MRLKTYANDEDRSWWKPFEVGVVGLVREIAGRGALADVIAGRDSRFRGTQGTSIIGLFGAGAVTGRGGSTGLRCRWASGGWLGAVA